MAEGPPGVTSLTDPKVKCARNATPSVTLRRGPVTAVITDHSPLDAGHHAGYSGVASLVHRAPPDNLFVPLHAGLNFELMFDGTEQPRDVMFEPRRAPMELRLVSRSVVELYQAPTPHWKLESCTRAYGCEMRLAYLPFRSREEIGQLCAAQRWRRQSPR